MLFQDHGNMGTGKVSDVPKTDNGCSWGWREESGSMAWTTAGGDFYQINLVLPKPFYTQVIKIFQWMLLIWLNYGIVVQSLMMVLFLKHTSSVEFSSSFVETNYFSMDTHTIYPPELEFKWDDSSYSLTTLSAVTSSDFVISFTNIKEEFEDTAIYDFRVKARDTFPYKNISKPHQYI